MKKDHPSLLHSSLCLIHTEAAEFSTNKHRKKVKKKGRDELASQQMHIYMSYIKL